MHYLSTVILLLHGVKLHAEQMVITVSKSEELRMNAAGLNSDGIDDVEMKRTARHLRHDSKCYGYNAVSFHL